MDKTIEDRALSWKDCNSHLYKLTSPALMEMSYIQGATDQRAIDIESACKWLEENFESLQASQDRRSDRDNFLEDLKQCMNK